MTSALALHSQQVEQLVTCRARCHRYFYSVTFSQQVNIFSADPCPAAAVQRSRLV